MPSSIPSVESSIRHCYSSSLALELRRWRADKTSGCPQNGGTINVFTIDHEAARSPHAASRDKCLCRSIRRHAADSRARAARRVSGASGICKDSLVETAWTTTNIVRNVDDRRKPSRRDAGRRKIDRNRIAK